MEKLKQTTPMTIQLRFSWLKITRVEVEVNMSVLSIFPSGNVLKKMKLVIEHISIEHMIGDPLTIGMPPKELKDHVVRMGLGSFM